MADAYRVIVTSSEMNPTIWLVPLRRVRAAGLGR